ncbi:MAG: PQQ-dependent sugar dehydrogenase [Parafilimonas sp.]
MLQYFLFIFVFVNTIFSCGDKDVKQNSVDLPSGITAKVLVHNLSYPWEILWGPDNFIWFTERPGKISRVNPANGSVTPLLQISEVKSRGEGGLLGMALHPDFTHHPYIYAAYDYEKDGDYKEKIVRYTYNGKKLINPIILLDNINAGGIHNGCRLLISSDLKLFITTGETGNQSYAQNINAVNGKILRINLDGTIPADNPFPNNPVWSYGHRNAQGLVFVNGSLFSSEHGPDSDDEINLIEKGRNYGWPTVKGFCNNDDEKTFCNAHNVKEPLYAWTPTLAVCGLDYYNKDLIPEWKNSLLLCTLKGSKLVQLKLNSSHSAIVSVTEFFSGEYGRMRDICISPDGKVYLCTSNGSNDVMVQVTKK